MDLKQLKEPHFFLTALNSILLILFIIFWLVKSSPSENIDLSPQIKQLQSSIKATENHLITMGTKLDHFQQQETGLTDTPEGYLDDTLEFHTKADAEKLVKDFGKSPTAEKLSEALGTIDMWVAQPEEIEALQKFKVSQIALLRKLVKKEVEALHDQSLNAENGNTAIINHAKASQILSLYPMDSTKEVLDEARRLSSQNSEVSSRIAVIRRQRYNAWAMKRIEEIIKAINNLASSFSTSDNPKIIDATIEQLGPVDPNLLEPIVAQLYNFAVEQAKSNINSDQQLELGRRMIDPKIKRKGYGDF